MCTLYVPFLIKVTHESAEDQEALSQYPTTMKQDLVYDWVREGTRGAQGLPLNIQIVGKPWQEERVLAAMKLVSTVQKMI